MKKGSGLIKSILGLVIFLLVSCTFVISARELYYTKEGTITPPVISDKYIAWSVKKPGQFYNLIIFSIDENIIKFKKKVDGESGYVDVYDDYVVFTSNQYGNYDVFLYNILSKEFKQITQDELDDVAPKIYDNNIVWTRIKGDKNGIFYYDLNSNTERQLTNYDYWNDEAVVSENKVAWIQHDEEKRNIKLHDIKTGITTYLTNDEIPHRYHLSFYENKLTGIQSDYFSYSLFLIDTTTGEAGIIKEKKITKYLRNTYFDSNKILWDDEEDNQIYLYDLDTNQETRVSAIGENYHPNIKNDVVAWISEGDDKRSVMTCEINIDCATDIIGDQQCGDLSDCDDKCAKNRLVKPDACTDNKCEYSVDKGVCVKNECGAECSSSIDCVPGSTCIDCKCVEEGTGGGGGSGGDPGPDSSDDPEPPEKKECNSVSDCESSCSGNKFIQVLSCKSNKCAYATEQCVIGACEAKCNLDSDCDKGFKCEDCLCVEDVVCNNIKDDFCPDPKCIGIDPDCNEEYFESAWPICVFEPLCCEGGKTGEDCDPSKHINCETNVPLPDPHLHRFKIKFEDIIINSGKISCIIDTKDGNQKTVSTEFSSTDKGNVYLYYTLTKNDPIDRTQPWEIKNCFIETSDSGFKANFDNKFSSVNKLIYVHKNTWTGFEKEADGSDPDAQRAFDCYFSTPGAYFDNKVKCDWEGDLNFAVARYLKDSSIELVCDDSKDDEGIGDGIDCGDDDCTGVPISICPLDNQGKVVYSIEHPALTGLFGSNRLFRSNLYNEKAKAKTKVAEHSAGLGIITGQFAKVTGAVVASDSKCKGNICKGSIKAGSTINFEYTQHVSNNNGKFKIKFNLGTINSAKITSNAIDNLPAIQRAGKYSHPAKGSLSQEVVNPSSYITKGVVKGKSIDHVMYIQFASLPEKINNLVIGAGTYGIAAQDSNNVKFFVDKTSPANDNEADNLVYGQINTNKEVYGIFGQVLTDNNPCNDKVDNDLDYFMDCRDLQCNNVQVGKTKGNDPIKCEHDGTQDKEWSGQSSGEKTCWDGYDNDGDGKVDCADPDCDQQIGAYYKNNVPIKYKTGADQSQFTKCEYNKGKSLSGSKAEGTLFYEKESEKNSCNDKFDNDADKNPWTEFFCVGTDCRSRSIDCYDLYSCWGRGDTSIIKSCPRFENNKDSWCWDGIDNDFDKGFFGANNWLGINMVHPYGFGPFANTFDRSKDTSADCLDYDCHGVKKTDGSYVCPMNEADNAERCFDGLDNDLDAYKWDGSNYVKNKDGGIDCWDPDCLGVKHPTEDRVCAPYEFNLFKYDLCKDGEDNDFDEKDGGGRDGADDKDGYDDNPNIDCYHRFNLCGVKGNPGLSVVENIYYGACADKENNDADGSNVYDCADHDDCDGMIGTFYGAECVSAGAENTQELCSDGFDNDAKSGFDCSDKNCFGKRGSRGQVCGLENTNDLCSDGYDNNGNGLVDCAESSCKGKAKCDSSDWKSAGCLRPMPYYASGKIGSVSYKHLERFYVNNNYELELSSSKSYTSLKISLGANDPADGVRFPYDTSKCTLQGPNKKDFLFSGQGTYMLTLLTPPGKKLNSFNVKIICSGVNKPTS